MIKFISDQNLFQMETENYSYTIEVFKEKYLRQIFWGKKIEKILSANKYEYWDGMSFCIDEGPSEEIYTESLDLEFGQQGSGDFRTPSVEIYNESGNPYPILEYSGFEIIKGKPEIPGMPSTREVDNDNLDTLILTLKDPKKEIFVDILYSVYHDYDVMTRSMSVKNCSNKKIDIEQIMSFTLDLPAECDNEELELLSLEGSWARERHIETKPLRKGKTTISSNRGTSSHTLHPFCALTPASTTEHRGNVWSFSLIYSGNFVLELEKTHTDKIRVSGGINPNTFKWLLDPKETFYTPESVLVYSENGLNGMSNIYHRFFRDRLLPPVFANKERPVLINNWESTYFDFDHDKIVRIAQKAKEVGIELCVLDDGWFGTRNDDTGGLGNWEVNYKKLTKGLEGLAEDINKEGMAFGLWVEPEMVNSDAVILKEHPDWIMGSYKEKPAVGRNQYVLDLVNPDVVSWLTDLFTEIFTMTNLTYVKWDMNRYLTGQFSEYLPAHRKKETSHRYVLGLYKLMEALVTSFPKILFEGCSGGGGRMDPGLLYYMPQYWTSDNTDAMARLKIQYGTSLIYPLITMGSHVSACPNHQLGRSTPMETRLNVAMSGNLGFELDLNLTLDNEIELVKKSIEFYKENRALIQLGEFYRLLSPFNGQVTSWMFINKDKSEFIVFWVLDKAEVTYSQKVLKLPYVSEDMQYKTSEGVLFTGGELKYRGLKLPYMNKDYMSGYFHFIAE